MHNRSAFLFIIHHLRKAGMNNLIPPNFRPVSGSISDFAAQLAAAVNLAIQRTGSEKVDLVGHSMGGLIIRFYIEHLGGSSHVSRAVLLGAPVLGTKMAVLSPFKTAQQFRLDSPLVAELNASHSSTNSVNYISIWSDFDNMIIPPENAKMPAPSENIMVRGVGHVALLFSRQVITQLKNTLLKGSAV
jgi:triacylglycerol esterase/lipase EstA (alpha/beta hydrolase family)